jgi:hypothetical protein
MVDRAVLLLQPRHEDVSVAVAIGVQDHIVPVSLFSVSNECRNTLPKPIHSVDAKTHEKGLTCQNPSIDTSHALAARSQTENAV